MSSRLTAAAVLLVAGRAAAVGGTFEGHLDAPDGQRRVTVALFEDSAGGEPLFSAEVQVEVAGGRYSLPLGAEGLLVPAPVLARARFLQVSSDGAALAPPQPLGMVPRADTATDIAGSLTVRTLTIGGQLVIDAQGNWVGPTSGREQLSLARDSDADTWPDWMEVMIGHDPYDAGDAPLDADEDGVADALQAPPSDADPALVPPDGLYLGKTYGEWAGTHYQWFNSIPAGVGHPLWDATGEDCGRGQSGPVWFLGGTVNEEGVAERVCHLPSSKAIFFPVISTFCSVFDGDADTAAGLRACNHEILGSVDLGGMRVELDHQPIGQLDRYLVESGQLTLGPLPAGNIIDFYRPGAAPEGATTPAFAAGYFLMLRPLPPGEHDLHFSAHVGGDYDITMDLTYTLVVEDGPGGAR